MHRMEPHSPWPNGALLCGSGITIAPTPKTTILHLEAAHAVDALPAVGHTTTIPGADLLSIGPDVYWLLGHPENAVTFLARFAVCLDMTDAWAGLRIGGSNAAALLAKGTAIDLDPRVFQTRRCATASFAQLRTVLWRPSEGSDYELFVGRSYALSLWEWLVDAFAEYRVGNHNNER
ncbi:sarcosine oxidase subunit gamma [Leptospira interrogans]